MLDLEQARRQAKELLRAARAHDAGALARLTAHSPRAADAPKLADAQLAVARELGFQSWPALVAATGTPPVTLARLAEKKRRREPIVMVTAYDYPSAQAAEEAAVDLVLAGDTAAMTVLGYPGTEPVSQDEMLTLTKAVRRGLRTPLLVGDLPFGAYEGSDERAVASAQRLVKEAGCDAVKFEGPLPSRAGAMSSAGIPVMGHLGLTPQSATALGGFTLQARSAEAAVRLLDDALALERAGCFALVLEAVPSEVGELASRRLRIPTIGIGAGPGTDGQVLVFNDLLGIFEEFRPRFVKRYAGLRREMVNGVRDFVEDVRAKRYPGPEHAYEDAV